MKIIKENLGNKSKMGREIWEEEMALADTDIGSFFEWSLILYAAIFPPLSLSLPLHPHFSFLLRLFLFIFLKKLIYLLLMNIDDIWLYYS